MVKVGPAFFDSISDEKIYKVRSSSKFTSSDLLTLLPVFCLVLFFAIILVRLFYIQILHASYYKNLSEQNRTRTEIIAAPRGIIFDRFGRPLVSNSPAFNITENGKVRFIARDEALQLISQGKSVANDVERNYIYKSAFTHVLGYTGQISADEITKPSYDGYSSLDFVGKAGLESQYEDLLHGTNGKRLYEVDAKGEKIRELGTEAAIPGQDLKTTLDRDIGLSVASHMKDVKSGAVVVSDPRDGSIRALYSAPSFDPNVFTHADNYRADGDYQNVESILNDSTSQPLLDRSISGTFPPGSTFKLIAATAALEKGSITLDTQIEDTGVLKVGSFSFGNWYFLQYGRTEGNLNIVGAIKRSNDIFFYKTAEQTGVDYISSWARTFGLGSRLGLDLQGEAKGTVPTVEWKEKIIGEQWYLGDTYNYGIGQGYLLTTPLQVNMFTTVFANGGTLFRPHLIQENAKILKKDFIKSANIDLVRQGMIEACDTGGVAWPLFQFKVKNSRLPIDNRDYFQDASSGAQMSSGLGGPPARWARIKVACKTGTAEVGGDKNPDAWITVFAPFYKPEIAVTVLVENGGEGSSIAGPIAKQILTDYFEKK